MKNFKLSDIKPDDRNANKHSAFGMSQLETSIEQNGVIESITISADNVAISGNARTEKFYQKGMEDCILIETDGTKPVVIKRTDIKSKTRKFYNAALAANIVAKNNIVMDAEVTDAICEEVNITDWNEGRNHSESAAPVGDNEDEQGSPGFLNYTPSRKDDGEKDYQPNVFPLAISVDKAHQVKWNDYKKSIQISRDSEAFVNLLNSVI